MKKINNFWTNELKAYEHDSINEDYYLFESPDIFKKLSYPHKMNMTLLIFCKSGSVDGLIDLNEFNEKAPCSITILVNQILTITRFSEDFSGQFTLYSTPFLENLFNDRRVNSKLYLVAKKNPIIRMDKNDLQWLNYFNEILKISIKNSDNFHRLEIVKHLTLTFYYSHNYKYYEDINEKEKSQSVILVKEFLDLVSIHFKNYRGMDFYAKKLFLTPKYLSKVIKEISGKSGNEWINEHVILEAKALLKSTHMTIQQISDELNFPNQSFFGSYFKSHMGISPKQYRLND